MKKILLIAFATVLLSLTSYSQKKQTDLEFEGLRGRVKSVQGSSIYLDTKDKSLKSPKRNYESIISYGLDGNIAETLNPERGLKYVYQFVDGFLSMQEIVVDKQKAANVSRVSSFGNAEDMEKPVKTIKPDERFLTRFDDEYNDKGHRRLRRIFFSDGLLNSITLFSYNSTDLLEKTVYNTYGNKWSHFYSYDKDGNLKIDIMKRSNIKNVVDMTDRTEYSGYKFDAEGNWIERKYINHYNYDNSITTSEGFDYRDIKYYGADKPEKKPTGKIE